MHWQSLRALQNWLPSFIFAAIVRCSISELFIFPLVLSPLFTRRWIPSFSVILQWMAILLGAFLQHKCSSLKMPRDKYCSEHQFTQGSCQKMCGNVTWKGFITQSANESQGTCQLFSCSHATAEDLLLTFTITIRVEGYHPASVFLMVSTYCFL